MPRVSAREKLVELCVRSSKRLVQISTLSVGGEMPCEDLAMVGAEHRFTLNALFRLGFKWPIIGDHYMERIISALDSLDFFSKQN